MSREFKLDHSEVNCIRRTTFLRAYQSSQSNIWVKIESFTTICPVFLTLIERGLLVTVFKQET